MRFEDMHVHTELCTVDYKGIGRPPKPWCVRFANKLVYVGDCWIWRNVQHRTDSQRNRLNFEPYIGRQKGTVDACRWIYTQAVGTIPAGLELDHFRCNNWRCVHPHHLEPVTSLVNNSRYAHIRTGWTVRDEYGQFAGRSADDMG